MPREPMTRSGQLHTGALVERRRRRRAVRAIFDFKALEHAEIGINVVHEGAIVGGEGESHAHQRSHPLRDIGASVGCSNDARPAACYWDLEGGSSYLKGRSSYPYDPTENRGNRLSLLGEIMSDGYKQENNAQPKGSDAYIKPRLRPGAGVRWAQRQPYSDEDTAAYGGDPSDGRPEHRSLKKAHPGMIALMAAVPPLGRQPDHRQSPDSPHGIMRSR